MACRVLRARVGPAQLLTARRQLRTTFGERRWPAGRSNLVRRRRCSGRRASRDRATFVIYSDCRSDGWLRKYVNVGSEITFFEEPVSRVPNQRVHPIRDTRELHEEIGGDVRPAHVGQFVPQHVPQALDGPPRGNRRQEGPTDPAPTLHTIAAPKKNTSHRAGIHVPTNGFIRCTDAARISLLIFYHAFPAVSTRGSPAPRSRGSANDLPSRS